MQTAIWLSIIIAGVISIALRVMPFILFRRKPLDKDHVIFQYLGYFAYAIMGCIIYDAAFNSHGISLFWQDFSAITALKLFGIIVAFLAFFWLRRPFISLVIAVVVYGALLYFMM